MNMLLLYLIYIFCEDTNSTKKNKVNENPISSISFSRYNNLNYANLSLKRAINVDEVNIMGSSTPNDENSYIIMRSVTDDIRTKNKGKRMFVPLLDDDEAENDITYSIQIVIDDQYYPSEAFVYDESAGMYRLARDGKRSKSGWKGWQIVLIVLLSVALALMVLGFILKFVFGR